MLIKKSKEKNKALNKYSGSGILVVVLSSIALYIYVSSVYAEQEHFNIMQNKYEKNIIAEYESKNNNIEEFYEETLELNNNNSVRLNLR